MTRTEQIAIGLSELIGAEVRITGMASVGAQRATFFIDILDGTSTTPAVAQVSASVLGSVPASAEAAMLRLAEQVGVPVPDVIAVSDDLPGVGAPALVVSRIEGRTVPRHILRGLTDEAAGESLARQCGEALARLHTIGEAQAPASLPRLTHTAYVDDLEAKLDALDDVRPAVRAGLAWLRANPIPEAPITLVHADFRNGNMIVDDNGLAAVLDWELAQVTDPMQDLAWMCLRTWRFGNDAKPVGGFGSVAALRSGYEAAGGSWRADAIHWWSVARCAWWAIGLAGQAAAFTSGLTDAIMLAASGRRVPELEYDLLRLIADGPAD